MSARRADAPSLGVVLVGGIGVLVVVGFVAALALGGGGRSTPGERVALVRADGPAGVAVLAGRCRDQRVSSVEVRGPSGVRWRLVSDKGSIERRYVVGAPPPLNVREDVPLTGELAGRVTVSVGFDGPDGEERDQGTYAVAAAGAEGEALGRISPPCGGAVDLGPTVLLFGAAAALVVAGYAVMLARLRQR